MNSEIAKRLLEEWQDKKSSGPFFNLHLHSYGDLRAEIRYDADLSLVQVWTPDPRHPQLHGIPIRIVPDSELEGVY